MYKQDIMQMAELGAAAVLKSMQPSSDELSQREAYKFAGRAWLKWQIKQGNLVGVRRGNALMYSKLEILSLRRAETDRAANFIPRIIFKNKKHENLR
ncbi:MAG: hypothetical protein RR285_11830 [Acinetobacter sp.]